jgi:hypothetical protein
MTQLIDLMVEGCQDTREKGKKPVFVTVSLDPYLEDEEDRHYNLMIKRAFAARGFPVYSNMDAAIKALSNLCKFSHSRR